MNIMIKNKKFRTRKQDTQLYLCLMASASLVGFLLVLPFFSFSRENNTVASSWSHSLINFALDLFGIAKQPYKTGGESNDNSDCPGNVKRHLQKWTHFIKYYNYHLLQDLGWSNRIEFYCTELHSYTVNVQRSGQNASK